jgi:osmoprotectant transport system permease protein
MAESDVAAAVLAQANTQRWFWWDWIERNTELIWTSLREHIVLTVVAVLLGLLIALPLGVAAARWRRIYPPALAVTGVLYTIPSLAAFAFLVPFTGLSRITALIPLTTYTLLILLRNVVTGLDQVPPEVKDSADGMGYTRWKRLVGVELPLAMPAIFAGIRIATVTIIGLTAVSGLLAIPNLGQLILVGHRRPIRTAITVGVALSVTLAVLADLALIGVQRLLTPWTRAER